MPEIFQGTQVPAWLQDIAKPVDAEKTGEIFGSLISSIATAGDRAKAKNKTLPADQQTNWLSEMGSGFRDNLNRLKDPLWDQHVTQAQLGIAQQGLQMKQQQAELDQKKQQTLDIAEDQKSLNEYKAKYPTEKSRIDAPLPNIKTEWGRKALNDIRNQDSKSTVNKAIQNDVIQFGKDLAAVDAATRARIRAKKSNPDGTPSEEQINDLSKALEAKKVAEQNEAAAAEAQAIAGGETPDITVTQGPKGTTTTKKFRKPGHWAQGPDGEWYYDTGKGTAHFTKEKITPGAIQSIINAARKAAEAETANTAEAKSEKKRYLDEAKRWSAYGHQLFPDLPFEGGAVSTDPNNPLGLKKKTP